MNITNTSTAMRLGSSFIGTSKPWTARQSATVWVKLLELPNPYSDDEALLLCQHSEREWVVWIPNHGEAVIPETSFCRLS